jgi:hypothetical protein
MQDIEQRKRSSNCFVEYYIVNQWNCTDLEYRIWNGRVSWRWAEPRTAPPPPPPAPSGCGSPSSPCSTVVYETATSCETVLSSTEFPSWT